MSYLKSINHKVVELTPFALNKLARYTPKILLKHSLQTLLNQLFKQSIKSGELDFLANRWVRILVTDMDFSFDISLYQCHTNSKIVVAFQQPNNDLIFSSHSDLLLLLALNKVDPDTLFFQRKLGIQGNTELGLSIKNLLASLDLTQQLPAQLSSWIKRAADDIYNKTI